MTSRRTVGCYRIFDVVQHDVVDGAGRPRGAVTTFECPDWCNVVALTDEQEIVMVWQYRFGVDAIGLELPGGLIDPGETPVDAAKRELAEETGYAAASFEPLGAPHPNPALQNNRCHSFLARGAHVEFAPTPDELEELEVVLVPARHIPDLIDDGHVTHALMIAALARVHRTLTST